MTKIHTESLAIMAGVFCLGNMLTLSPGYKFRKKRRGADDLSSPDRTCPFWFML